MYRIGDFAKKVNTSIRTLRFYDSIDLFKPDDIDLFTGYRYYSDNQIEEFNLIIKLKEIGFSLDEIKENRHNLNNRVMLDKKEKLLKDKDNIDIKIKMLDELRAHLDDKNKKETKDIKVLRKE